MIKEKYIYLILNSKTINHYLKLGYIGSPNQKIRVKIKDLTKGSHAIITAICKKCKKERKLKYKSYLKNISKQGYYCCHKCCIDKIIKTYEEKYNGLHPANVIEIQEKRRKTCLKKYGKEYYFQSDVFLNGNFMEKTKKTKINKGLQKADGNFSEWELYNKKCRNITKKNRKKILEKWDGYDYYDGEYIKENFKLKSFNKNYPTIDHKISIFYGFKNNITPEDISDINNLCITKKFNNCKKYQKSEKEYKALFEN